MNKTSDFRLQLVVFALVSASFTNIYITQPVLPILRTEFGADLVTVSFTVSAVIFGIALFNLPFGYLSDRFQIHPIILTGGIVVALSGFVCALTKSLWILITARFIQGAFIPALTTCIAAYLSKTLPVSSLNIVMGSYVSATVLGGMGGRLLGGWIHKPLHWRYAFVSAAILILIAVFIALRELPKGQSTIDKQKDTTRYIELLKRWELLHIYLCVAGSFSVFSSIFNYLPFRLQSSVFNFSTEMTTLIYLVYIIGIFLGPITGRISNRFGSGNTLIYGTLIFTFSLLLILIPSVTAIILGLLGVCTGHFTIHAAAVGSLNRKLTKGQGRANALYVLFYYISGWIGITGSGFAYKFGGWSAVIFSSIIFLSLPLSTGFSERSIGKKPKEHK